MQWRGMEIVYLGAFRAVIGAVIFSGAKGSRIGRREPSSTGGRLKPLGVQDVVPWHIDVCNIFIFLFYLNRPTLSGQIKV
jgi:hypothetical protein